MAYSLVPAFSNSVKLHCIYPGTLMYVRVCTCKISYRIFLAEVRKIICEATPTRGHGGTLPHKLSEIYIL